MDRLSPLNRKSKARQTALIHKLPTDILHLIFIRLLPSPDSVISATAEASAFDLFNTTAPYNISRVCCSWREFALSSASLWSEFSLSFSNPSNRTLEQATTAVSLHLQRSQNMSLTFAVRLFGTYDEKLPRKISDLLCEHQKRWRRAEFWFDSRPHCRGDEPVIKFYLIIEDLNQLEDLATSYAAKCCTGITSDYNILKPNLFLPSLVRLSLETTEGGTTLARWLKIVPNVKVLNLTFYPDHPRLLGSPLDHAYKIPNLHMSNLQTIHISCGLYDTVELMAAAKASAFVVRFLSCPALTDINLRLDGDTCIPYLRDFFLRSAPSLQKLHLHIFDRPSGDNCQMALSNQIVATLALLPSLSEFRLELRALDDAGLLLQALTSRLGPGPNHNTLSALLPVLELLELHSMYAQPSLFIDLISSRWRAHGRTLKTVTLAQCSARRYGSRFPTFSLGGDSSRFPEAWAAMKDFISEGLRFEVR